MPTITAHLAAQPPHGAGPTFRNPAARDRAWGRYYARHGLAPCTRSIQPLANPLRRALYAFRRALVDGALH